MYPSRPAPSPPSPSLRADGSLPPDHPFATYYIPPQYNDFNSSTTSLHYASSRTSSSVRTKSPPSSPSSYRWQSPTASLAQPLSPRRTSARGSGYAVHSGHTDRYGSELGHFSFASQPLDRTRSSPVTPAPHPAYSRSSPSPAHPTYALPNELNLFDSRPRQTLLSDVEYVLGKKLSFPFLNSLTASRKIKNMGKGKEKEKKGRRMTKEKDVGQDWDCRYEGIEVLRDVVIVSDEKEKRRSGRGVREGNWL